MTAEETRRQQDELARRYSRHIPAGFQSRPVMAAVASLEADIIRMRAALLVVIQKLEGGQPIDVPGALSAARRGLCNPAEEIL